MSDESIPQTGTHPAGSDPFATAKATAAKAAEDFRAAAAAKAQEFRNVAGQQAQHIREVAVDKAHEYKDKAQHLYEEARERTQGYAAEAEKFAREKPIQALLTAFGVGFLAGLILKR